MNKTPDVLLSTLEKDTSPCPHVVVAWGEEPYFKTSIRRAMRQKAFPTGEEPSEWAFQDAFAMEALREAINTAPFLGSGNWVVVENPEVLQEKKKDGGKSDLKSKKKKAISALQQFTEILSDVPDYAYVLCLCEKLDKRTAFFKQMSKNAVVMECSPVKYYQLQPWLRETAEKYQSRFTPEAMNLIMEYVSAAESAPLLFLEQEIRKIALYAGKRKVWGKDDVEQMFSQLPEISGFALSNAVEERKLDRVLYLLAEERKQPGSDGKFPMLLGSLVASIRRLIQVKELKAKGAQQDKIVEKLRLHPYAVKLTMQHSNYFSMESLQDCMIALAKLAVESRQSGRTWPRLEEILAKLLTEN